MSDDTRMFSSQRGFRLSIEKLVSTTDCNTVNADRGRGAISRGGAGGGGGGGGGGRGKLHSEVCWIRSFGVSLCASGRGRGCAGAG